MFNHSLHRNGQCQWTEQASRFCRGTVEISCSLFSAWHAQNTNTTRKESPTNGFFSERDFFHRSLIITFLWPETERKTRKLCYPASGKVVLLFCSSLVKNLSGHKITKYGHRSNMCICHTQGIEKTMPQRRVRGGHIFPSLRGGQAGKRVCRQLWQV